MAEDKEKLLIEYNKLRETRCLLEGKSETSWLRPQRRHFPQSNRTSEENVREEKQEFESGRTSWIKITPLRHKERRHFPERNDASFILASSKVLVPVQIMKTTEWRKKYGIFHIPGMGEPKIMQSLDDLSFRHSVSTGALDIPLFLLKLMFIITLI